MKKNIKKLFLLMVLLGLNCLKVDAATVSIGSGSAGSAQSGSVSIELKDDDLNDYTKVEFSLSVSNESAVSSYDFSYKASAASGSTFSQSNGVYTITNPSGLNSAIIGTISFTTTDAINSNFKIVPTNVKFYKEDGTSEDGKVSEGEIKYEAPKSSDATLTSLVVSQGSLSPEFSADVTDYEVTVSDTINSIKITATPSKGATKSGDYGNKTLSMGENKFQITITAEDGTTTKTYNISVYRGEKNEPSAYLKSLTVNNIGVVLSPTFDKLNNKYTVDVTSDITVLDLDYELEDTDATISIEGNKDFTEGENKVIIKVKASDNSDEQTYEITVNMTSTESTKEVEEEKEEEKKKTSTWVIVLIIIIILAIITGTAFLLFKKKKSNGNKPNKKDKDSKDKEQEDSTENDESVTKILKGELYDDDKTNVYEKDSLDETFSLEEDIEKTKEFNFSDFRS